MKKKLNPKFFLSAIMLFTMGLLLRPVLLNMGLTHDYFAFFPGLVIIPAIHFFRVSFSPEKHHLKQAVYLAAGVIVIKLFAEAGNYNLSFYMSSLGVLMGLLIIEFSLIPRIKRWFMK